MKEKIAITIDDKLLSRVDRAVNGDTIRNRSHAIEYFLNKGLGETAEKALIISGYKDFSCTTAVNGKPMIVHQLELLKKHGVKKVLISVGSKEKNVEKLIGDGSAFGIDIQYHWQPSENMRTTHIIALAKKFVGGDTFFMLYGDVVADIDLADFAFFHKEYNATATIALTSVKDPFLYGAVKMKGGKVVGFEEKPKENEGVSRVISAGVFCFDSEIFAYVEKAKQASLETDVFPKLVQEKRLAGYMFEGSWQNVRNQIYSNKK